MDLLETILRTCDAESYSENFKNNGVDAFTLKIINEDDMKILGIKDNEVREKLLEHIANLQIPSEKRINIDVNNQYLFLTLSQMSIQLNKHVANLSCALKRDDTIICNMRVSPIATRLQHGVESIEKQLNKFEGKILHKNKARKKYSKALFPSIASVTALILIGLFVRRYVV